MGRRLSMKKNKLILLIDGENILHQSFHKFEKLKSTEGKPSGAIFGFFKSLHMYLTRWDPDDVIITFDNGHSSLRMELNPSYKEHRKNIAVDYSSLQEQKAIILKMLAMLRIKYIFDKNNINDYEGDDYLAYLAFKYREKHRVMIISSDKDFNQLINKNLKIYNPRKDEIVNQHNCKDLFGYSPEETIDYLSMVGDTSDDIKGIPGIGPVKARKILDEWGTLNNYLEHHHQTSFVQIAERNNKLINLKWFIDNIKLDKLPMKDYKSSTMIKYEKFRNKAIEYSMSSFLTKQFIEPFSELNKKRIS